MFLIDWAGVWEAVLAEATPENALAVGGAIWFSCILLFPGIGYGYQQFLKARGDKVPSDEYEFVFAGFVIGLAAPVAMLLACARVLLWFLLQLSSKPTYQVLKKMYGDSPEDLANEKRRALAEESRQRKLKESLNGR